MQLYCHFDITATALATTLRRMEDCLDVMKQWMTPNCLCMNDNKTEYLPVIHRTAAVLVDSSVIRVGDVTIITSRSVRNLCVVMDQHLDLNKQVSSIVSVCSFHLRHINRMSHYLPRLWQQRNVSSIHGAILKLAIKELAWCGRFPTFAVSW